MPKVRGYLLEEKEFDEGVYAKVYRATKEGKEFVVKVERVREEFEGEKEQLSPTILVESDVLRRFRHPNLLHAIEIFIEAGSIHYVFEKGIPLHILDTFL